MNVEKALKADIDALVELRIEYLREDHGCLSDDVADQISGSLPAYFSAHLGRDLFCYGIRDGKEIVSCAFLIVVEKPMSPAFINGKTGTVLNVYTKPPFRHKGYAKAVMEELVSDAKRMGLCVLELI